MFKKVLALGTALGLAGQASAQAVDLTALTTAVDFSTATTAVLAVAAAVIVVYIAIKAAGFVVNMVRRG